MGTGSESARCLSPYLQRALNWVTGIGRIYAPLFVGYRGSSDHRERSSDSSQDPPPVAKVTGQAGGTAVRSFGSREFRCRAADSGINAGESLLLLPGASVRTQTGMVVNSLADFDGRAATHVFESAVILNEPKDVDLDLTLDRGRISVTNDRPVGQAVIRVRFRDQVWRVTQDSPGAKVAVEISGRWPAGSRFRASNPEGVPPPSPDATVTLTVLSGVTTIDVGGLIMNLKGPPGPARIVWDSVAGLRREPLRLDKLPDWADPAIASSPERKKVELAIEKFCRAWSQNFDAALDDCLNSADPVEQRIGLIAAGALDDLKHLCTA